MAGREGNGLEMRAGALALSLLSDPLNVSILGALENGSLPLAELRRTVGAPPQTTLRNHLRTLTEVGVITRVQQDGFPGSVSHDLTSSGRELREASAVLARWLAGSPDSALGLGSPAARNAIRALIGGWSSNILRALAAKPLSLTDLDRLITGVNYPALERRLVALRLTRQVAPGPANGSRPYSVTGWLREAVAPLFAAADWERRRCPQATVLDRLDIETIFLLAVPLAQFTHAPDGVCRLEVNLTGRNGSEAAGVVVAVEGGKARSCRTGLRTKAPSRASGSVSAWLDALSTRGASTLALRGDQKLAATLVSGLQGALTPHR